MNNNIRALTGRQLHVSKWLEAWLHFFTTFVGYIKMIMQYIYSDWQAEKIQERHTEYAEKKCYPDRENKLGLESKKAK